MLLQGSQSYLSAPQCIWLWSVRGLLREGFSLIDEIDHVYLIKMLFAVSFLKCQIVSAHESGIQKCQIVDAPKFGPVGSIERYQVDSQVPFYGTSLGSKTQSVLQNVVF